MSAPVHVTRGVNRRYIARVRMAGCRKYRVLTTTTSERKAVRMMAEWVAHGGYKRGDVLFVSDWYEPVQVFEMVRR